METAGLESNRCFLEEELRGFGTSSGISADETKEAGSFDRIEAVNNLHDGAQLNGFERSSMAPLQLPNQVSQEQPFSSEAEASPMPFAQCEPIASIDPLPT